MACVFVAQDSFCIKMMACVFIAQAGFFSVLKMKLWNSWHRLFLTELKSCILQIATFSPDLALRLFPWPLGDFVNYMGRSHRHVCIFLWVGKQQTKLRWHSDSDSDSDGTDTHKHLWSTPSKRARSDLEAFWLWPAACQIQIFQRRHESYCTKLTQIQSGWPGQGLAKHIWSGSKWWQWWCLSHMYVY